MISFGIVVAFVAEIVAYSLLCAILWKIHLFGMPIGAAAASLVTLILAARAAIAPLSFAAAWLWGTPRPLELRLRWPRAIAMVAAETGAFLIAIFLLMPFARRLTLQRRGHVSATSQPPVLFLHGYGANSGVWAPMLRSLSARGVANLFTIDLEPRFGSIDAHAQQVAALVTRLCSTTRSPKVILVAHSMGGLVARAYVERCGGTSRVAKVITIATPHHGSLLARFAPGANGAQMRPGSAWLDDLNREENTSHDVRYVSIYSAHDNMVVPYASAELGKARNILFPARGHFDLLFCKDVGQIVYRELTGH